MGESALNLIMVMYGAMGSFYALLGVLGIVGGIYALRLKQWGLALTAAIAAAIVFLPFGIVAVVFTSLSRGEFTAAKPVPQPVTPPPTSPPSTAAPL
jgi:hypothetical protein